MVKLSDDGCASRGEELSRRHAARADIAFVSDLPLGSGMGCSSALITGIFLAMAEVNRLAARDEYWHNIGSQTDLAGYLSTIENGQTFGTLAGDCGVGTCGGSEDHAAILCAEPSQISQYAFCPIEFEKMFRMPPGYLFAVAASGVTAEKSDAGGRDKYNGASRLASALVNLWRRETGRDDPHLAAALGSSADAVERLQAIVKSADVQPFTPEALLARLEHFMLESGEIIPAAGDALARGDLRAFGRLVHDLQRAAEQLLGNQTPETTFLAASRADSGPRRRRHLAEALAAAFGRWSKPPRPTTSCPPGPVCMPRTSRSTRNCASFFATGAGPAAFRVC